WTVLGMHISSGVGRAFRPDFHSRQAGKPDLPQLTGDLEPLSLHILTSLFAIGFRDLLKHRLPLGRSGLFELLLELLLPLLHVLRAHAAGPLHGVRTLHAGWAVFRSVAEAVAALTALALLFA